MRFISFFFALVLTACSIESSQCTDVNQAKIHQGYTVVYDAKDDETSATATLRFDGSGGNTLIMDGNCNIKHDTFSLAKSTFLGTSYSGSKNGYVAAHTFTFTDNNKKDFVNSITNANTIALSSPPSSVSRASDLTLTFTPAVAKGESVDVVMVYVSTPNGVTRSIATGTTSTEGATTATISKDKLAEMSSNASVYLYAERYLSEALDQATESEGGSISYKYRTARSEAALGA